VLANEQVIEGACERCGTPVEQKELEQWFFRITAYADRLLAGLDELTGWPEKVKTMQRNWIGRSEGADLDFPVEGASPTAPLTVFTTRPDTVHGATFMVLAPEHPLAARLVAGNPAAAEIAAWIERVRNTPRIQREGVGSPKEGRDTGARATNPATGERIPIWLANYVLPDYGTGAIMAVPAHDSRPRVRAPGCAWCTCRGSRGGCRHARGGDPRRGVIQDAPPFDGLEDGAETVQRFVR
jgi:leucyl-tRNA synthetase